MKNSFSGKDLARALRRHHAARLKQARKGYWGRNARVDIPLTDRQKGILLHTAAVCSCFMCGSPRRYLGEVTLQERCHAHALQEGLALSGASPKEESATE